MKDGPWTRGRRAAAVVAAGLLILVIGAIAALILQPFGGQENTATVIETFNKVNAHQRSDDGWQPAAVGMTVYGGGEVRTGTASSAQLRLLEGIVRLAADTVFAVKESVTRQGKLLTEVFLQEGRLWVHLTTDQPHELTVETGNAIAAVRDTRFSIKVTDGSTLLSVAEGEVIVTAQQQSVTVAAGQQAAVELGQPPSQPEAMSSEERTLWVTEGEMPELALPTLTPTPTSTPTPTLSPTPTGTSTPALTPTLLPTPTRTQTPMAVLSPTSTVLAGSTPLPTLPTTPPPPSPP